MANPSNPFIPPLLSGSFATRRALTSYDWRDLETSGLSDLFGQAVFLFPTFQNCDKHRKTRRNTSLKDGRDNNSVET